MEQTGTSRIILGLGNPGEEYENTYHNVGALAVERLVKIPGEGSEPRWKTHKKLFAYRDVGTVLIKPLVFMNESGLAAKEALKKFNAAPEDLIVIHDDSDLPLGEYKISRGQGSAGHKGVQSVIDHLGTNAFERIRIGVRAEDGERRKKAGDFVLDHISARDQGKLEKVFDAIKAALGK